MADHEQILRDETFKDQTDTVEQRIFYTLTKKKGMEVHRLCELLSEYLALEVNQGRLAEENLDELLFNTVRS